MVAVPLVQVLRYESAEMQAVLAQQASLDPIARAVAVQYGLLAHRDTAGLVLRGQQLLEPERQLRQGEVDDRLTDLTATLDALHSERAINEAQVLAQDWGALAQQVSAKQINADSSDAAHRLRVEQAVQVMDLVADAGGLQHHAGAAAYLASARQMAAASAPSAAPSSSQRAAHYQSLQASAGALTRSLAQRRHELQIHQRSFWALMATLAALASALGLSLQRGLRRATNPTLPPPPPPVSAAASATAEQTPVRAEAGRLLARMRQSGEAPALPDPGMPTSTDLEPVAAAAATATAAAPPAPP